MSNINQFTDSTRPNQSVEHCLMKGLIWFNLKKKKMLTNGFLEKLELKL